MWKLLPLLAFATTVLTGCVATGQKIPVTELHNQRTIELNALVHPAKSTDGKAVRAPTVILLHGCGGPENSNFQPWVDVLNRWGYNAVVVNSVLPRGVTQICDKPFSIVTPEQRAADAHATAQWVRQQEWATDKVGIIGFSHGGAAVLQSAAAKTVARNFGTQIIAVGVAYYPGCDIALNWDKPVMPVQFHTGSADSWTSAAQCRDLAKNWNVSDQYFEYAKATHGFDLVGANDLGYPDANGVRHKLVYSREDTDLSRQRTKVFLDTYLK